MHNHTIQLNYKLEGVTHTIKLTIFEVFSIKFTVITIYFNIYDIISYTIYVGSTTVYVPHTILTPILHHFYTNYRGNW